MSVMETMATKVTGRSAVERAGTKLSEAAARVQEWRTRVSELAGQLAAAQRDLGEVALESGDPAAAARGVTDLRDQHAAAQAAVVAAEAARVKAEISFCRAEAKEHRDDAIRLGGVADKHEVETARLLAALVAHEGTDFAPVGYRLGGERVIVSAGARTGELRGAAHAALTRAQELELRAVQLGEVAAA